MLVCHCHGVSDRAIRRAARNGAATRREVSRACRAGRSCGGCIPIIDKILASEAGKRTERAAPAFAELATGN